MNRAVYGTNFWITAPEKLAISALKYTCRASLGHSAVGAEDSKSALYFLPSDSSDIIP
jgi:hypothetical protein